MPISTAFTTSAKKELLEAGHNFRSTTGHLFKLALYVSAATLGASTTAYSTTNEVVGTGYTAGGASLVNAGVSISGTTAYTDFADVSFSSATFTSRGGKIYNSNLSNAAVSIHDFGSDASVTSGTLSVIFPAPDSTNAVIRII